MRAKISEDIAAWCTLEGIGKASTALRLAAGRKAATAAFDRLGEASGTRGERRSALRNFRQGVEAAAVNAGTVLYTAPPSLPPTPAPLPILLPTAKVLAAPSSSSSSSAGAAASCATKVARGISPTG